MMTLLFILLWVVGAAAETIIELDDDPLKWQFAMLRNLLWPFMAVFVVGAFGVGWLRGKISK